MGICASGHTSPEDRTLTSTAPASSTAAAASAGSGGYRSPRTAPANAMADPVMDFDPPSFADGLDDGKATSKAREMSQQDVMKIIERIPSNPQVASKLKKVPLLSTLTDDELAKLGGAFEERRYAKGRDIVRQGEVGNEFFVIQSGEVSVSVFNEEAKKQQEVAKLHDGDYFGEKALLDNNPRGATVTAVDKVTCLVLDRFKFHALFGHRLHIQFAKRNAISAETVQFRNVFHVPKDVRRDKSPVHQRLIQRALVNNLIFANIDQDQRDQIIAEMWRKEVAKGSAIIHQGESGDNFYVVERGIFDIFVAKGDAEEKKVAVRKAGQSFGELALMYNAPRAATVKASTDAVVWAIDRFSFRRILAKVSESKLTEYEQFLVNVPGLGALAKYERAKIAEALEEVEYEENQDIVKQGEEGDTFFIVRSGEVKVMIREGDAEPQEVARYKDGDYFGERALVKNEPRAATVTAVKPTRCLMLDRHAFSLLLGPLEDILNERVQNYMSPSESRRSSMVSTADGGASSSSSSSADASTGEVKAAGKENATANGGNADSAESEVQFEDLEVVGVLGKGSFGTVELVRHKKTGKTYALKSVSKAQVVKLGQQEHIVSERKVMSMLDHPFLIRLYTSFKDPHYLYFVLEPSMGGELFSVLRQRAFFPNDVARFYAGCVVLAFEYMHSKDIVYRDLKPENLLLDRDGYLKITDFGFAKVVKSRTWTLCGTPDYLAPEVVSGQGHGKGVDWWTLGILIYEMLASYPPFYDEDPMKTYAKIVRGHVSFPKSFSKEARDLIRGLLQSKATKRLGVTKGGASNIKKHPWFSGFDWDALYRRQIKAPIIPAVKSDTDLSNFEDYPSDHDGFIEYQDDGTGWDDEF